MKTKDVVSCLEKAMTAAALSSEQQQALMVGFVLAYGELAIAPLYDAEFAEIVKAELTAIVVDRGEIAVLHKMPGINGAYVFSRADVEQLAAQRTAKAAS